MGLQTLEMRSRLSLRSKTWQDRCTSWLQQELVLRKIQGSNFAGSPFLLCVLKPLSATTLASRVWMTAKLVTQHGSWRTILLPNLPVRTSLDSRSWHPIQALLSLLTSWSLPWSRCQTILIISLRTTEYRLKTKKTHSLCCHQYL